MADQFKKLTPPQLTLMRNIAKGKDYAVDYYKPVQVLLTRGLIEPVETTFNNRWKLTELGKKVLEASPAKAKK